MIKRKLQGWRTRTCLTCALGNLRVRPL